MDRILIEQVNPSLAKVVIITRATNISYIVNTYKLYRTYYETEVLSKEESKPLTSPEMRNILKDEINKCIDYFIPFCFYSHREDFFQKFPYFRMYVNGVFKKEHDRLNEDTPF